MTGPDSGEKEARERATVEAARWLVALDEAPEDPDLRARFERWLAADPENAAAWVDTADLYEMMARTPPAHSAQWAPYVGAGGEATAPETGPPGRARQALRAQQPPRRPRRRRIALAVAVGALAACIAVVALPPLLLRLEADHATATAELQSVALSDGSQVHLAPDSALAVDFEEGARLVRLLRGQAFFEVVPDAQRPFQVVSADVTTQVLGTAFEVRLVSRNAAVAVRHGRVGVTPAGGPAPVPLELQSGDWLRVDRDGKLQQGSVPADEVGAWLQGQMVVRDRPLAEAIDELRRYHAGFILLTDGALGARRVSGVYNLNDPVAALTAMAGAQGAVVRRLSPWVLLVSAD